MGDGHEKKDLAIRILFVLILSFTCVNSFTQDNSKQTAFNKEQIISILIRRIPNHIEWPEPVTFDENSKPFILGVFASPEFDFWFNELFLRKKIKNRPVTIKPIVSREDLEGVHMLFLSKKDEQDFSHIIQWVGDRPILIVSYSPEIIPPGVHINISYRDDAQRKQYKFKLQLNISRMKISGFRAGIYLLRTADIVIMDAPGKKEK